MESEGYNFARLFLEMHCNGEIVFNHADCHCSVICTLAFYMIDLVSNAQAGICNDGFVFCYLLIMPPFLWSYCTISEKEYPYRFPALVMKLFEINGIFYCECSE